MTGQHLYVKGVSATYYPEQKRVFISTGQQEGVWLTVAQLETIVGQVVAKLVAEKP